MTEAATVDALLDATVLFAVVLAFSLVIERALEILKCVYDLLDSRGHWHEFWTARARVVRDRLERQLHVFDYVDPKQAAPVVRRFQEMLLTSADGYDGTVPTISGDAVRALGVKVASKVLGVAVGVAIAFELKLDIVRLWSVPQSLPVGAGLVERLLASRDLRVALTGVVMGFGSTLVHKVITAIEASREERRQEVSP